LLEGLCEQGEADRALL